MREIVLDTETTGFDPMEGHRIVEIGAVELVNHMPTGRSYHQYVNPERAMPEDAFQVHGLSDAFLRQQPVFAQIVDQFVDFIADTRLVIHNASFDMRFINAELSWAKRAELPMDRALDTLALARRKFPGAPASLDALCRRFGIDNSAREKHGALLDSEILAEVYLQLIGGRQPDFALGARERSAREEPSSATSRGWQLPSRPAPLAPRLTTAERAAHADLVERLGDAALWRSFE